MGSHTTFAVAQSITFDAEDDCELLESLFVPDPDAFLAIDTAITTYSFTNLGEISSSIHDQHESWRIIDDPILTSSCP
jgi:hypothetical protein